MGRSFRCKGGVRPNLADIPRGGSNQARSFGFVSAAFSAPLPRLFVFEFESDLHGHPELAQRGPNGLECRDDLVGVGQKLSGLLAQYCRIAEVGSAGVAVFAWIV